MAYFYQHIKGLTSAGSNWKISFDLMDSSASNTMMNTPILTKENLIVGLGNLITSNCTYGRIINDFYFFNKVNFYTEAGSDHQISQYRGYITHDTEGLVIKGGLPSTGTAVDGNSAVLNINTTQFKMQGLQGRTQISFKTPNTYTTVTGSGASTTLSYTPIGFFIQKPDGTYGTNMLGFGIGCFDTDNSYTTWVAAEASESVTEWGKAKVWANIPIVSEDFILSRNYIVTTGYMKAYSYVEGLYFNATSDIRAKKNVHQSTFSALNVVKQLPIYNFNYNTDNSASIGIIAQEAENINLDGFDIVNNKEASGENGNYMTVKESKLVYIAWKAIQEQQEIIDKQQEQINKLTELVNKLIQK